MGLRISKVFLLLYPTVLVDVLTLYFYILLHLFIFFYLPEESFVVANNDTRLNLP